jgi:HD-GYP domain-containing protein (c-di-GMP phosphodiesterase class II)
MDRRRQLALGLAVAALGLAAFAYRDAVARSRGRELAHVRALARTAAAAPILQGSPSATTSFWIAASLRSLELASPEVVSARVSDGPRVDHGLLVEDGRPRPRGVVVRSGRVELVVRPRATGGSWLQLLPLALALGAAGALLVPRRSSRLVDELTSPAWQSAEVLLKALGARDPRLAGHLADVSELAVEVGRRLGLGNEELATLGQAAALHDIGKVAVPDAILAKPAPLDEEEWAVVRQVPFVGARIVEAAPALAPAAPLIRASHERFDGAGYPDGLRGGEIPLGARVIAVCTAWEAMAGRRAYRPGLTRRQALAELRAGAGGQFDPQVVAAFLAVLDDAELERRSRLRLVA